MFFRQEDFSDKSCPSPQQFYIPILYIVQNHFFAFDTLYI